MDDGAGKLAFGAGKIPLEVEKRLCSLVVAVGEHQWVAEEAELRTRTNAGLELAEVVEG